MYNDVRDKALNEKFCTKDFHLRYDFNILM